MGFFIDNSSQAPLLPGAAPVGSSFLGISTNGTDWTGIDKLSVQRVDPVFLPEVRYRWAPDRGIVGGANEVNPAARSGLINAITTDLGGTGVVGAYTGIPTTTDFGGKPIRIGGTVNVLGDLISPVYVEYSAGGGYKIGDKLFVAPGAFGVGSQQVIFTLAQGDLVGPGIPGGGYPQDTQAGVNEMYKYPNSTRIHMVLGNDAKIEFELQDLDPASPFFATWSMGSQLGLNNAIQDLTDWISDI
jgi:hypothetical protein